MKKASAILIIITVCICIFSVGFLLGMNLDRQEITVQEQVDVPQVTSVTKTTPRLININTASAEELCLLPGIGNTLAERIIDYRTTIGPFRNITELLNVEGIGERKFDKLMNYITVSTGR